MPVNIKIEPIYPKEKNFPLSKLDKLEKALSNWLRVDVAKELQDEFEKTVAGWRRRPQFPSTFKSGRGLSVHVGPKGKNTLKWQRISGGTGPRTIVPRDPSAVMSFPADYAPKTQPGGPFGGPGTKSGTIIRTKVVGRVTPHRIKPREFSKHIATPQFERKLNRDANEVVKKALK